MKKIKVFMGIPSTGNRYDMQSYALRDIQDRYSSVVEFVYPKQCVFRIFHDFARNAMVDEFLSTDCDVIWFLDSDVSPPRHIIDLIKNHWDEWQCAGAAYPVFMSPPGELHPQVLFTAYKGSNGTGMCPTRIPGEGKEFVDGMATGCIFIKREVFDKLERPWFQFKYDPENRNMVEGEDMGFCLKLSSLGIKFFTDYSMVCKHMKNVCLLDVNNYAMDYAKKAIAAYDQEIRGKVEALATRVRLGGKVNQPLHSNSQFTLP